VVSKIVVKSIKALVLLFIVGFTLTVSFWFGQKMYAIFWELPGEVEVPDLVGEDAAVADNLLKEKNLVLRIVDSQYQDDHPSNTIIKQEPPGGIMVRKDRQILAVISLGPELMEVPNLMGQSLRESRVAIGNNKLNLGKVTRVSKEFAEPGEVLGQNPQPGQLVKKGTEVRLMVNQGEETMVKVPKVVGKTLEDLTKELAKSNLDMGTITWVWSDTEYKGDIISQIPNSGSMAQPKSKVDVKISAGSMTKTLNLKQRNFVIFAPKGEGLQTIRVRQADDMGDRDIYEGRHAPGGKVSLTVHSLGDTELQIYNNTKMVQRIRF
jgi:eukaryotic-like serine/threonine-protein kinase